MILIDKPLLFQGVLSQCPTAALPHTARAYAHSASRCPMPVWWPTLVPAVEGEDLQTMLVAPGAPPSSWASQPSRFFSLHQERERGERCLSYCSLQCVCSSTGLTLSSLAGACEFARSPQSFLCSVLVFLFFLWRVLLVSIVQEAQQLQRREAEARRLGGGGSDQMVLTDV
jgi:hypothetical protein